METALKSSQSLIRQLVKSPSQASKSIPLPGPTPHLSGTKRKETLPVSTASNPPQQNCHPLHPYTSYKAEADNNVYCKICQLSCSSPFNLKQHLIGHKHRQKLLELESGGTSEKWCDMCKVSCMNEELLKLHFQGKKHKAQLQKLEVDQQGGEQLQNKQQKWCELCKIWCIDEFSFKQHLQGRKHILQLHAMEKEGKKKDKDALIL
ncbi:hypothetical protein PIB30_039526 [Stylosanthes scabra]|uniref:Uncharacterized protein n=1 Tax=Stylosanthes scabra TaxID=79078 RepID=A0ABU6REG3_9FABA|nr:hypothetical protein [Stylosanthes scabra]